MPKRLIALFPIFLLLLGCQTSPHRRAYTGPWNTQKLGATPKVSWGTRSNLVQEVFYEGEPFQGKPTRVFAYVGRPKGEGPFPGVVLVHGGGGKAFSAWAEHWAQRGYVAIAMDTAGAGPNGRMPDGGPDQSDDVKFRNFTAAEIPDMWSYQAVADVIRAHSLLLSLPEVDPKRTALTGIIWGGYLTCIVAGLDHRFKAAVPVFGCGFLGENSVWKDRSLAAMQPEARELWLKTFDPSQYLGGVTAPILFLNGTHDFAYPLDSYQKSYHLVKPRLRHLSIVYKLAHGHIWTYEEVDQFVDRALKHKSFPRIGDVHIRDGKVRCKSSARLKSAELYYTKDAGPWDKRVWQKLPAEIKGKALEVTLPANVPPNELTMLITATTEDSLRISSDLHQPQR